MARLRPSKKWSGARAKREKTKRKNIEKQKLHPNTRSAK